MNKIIFKIYFKLYNIYYDFKLKEEIKIIYFMHERAKKLEKLYKINNEYSFNRRG